MKVVLPLCDKDVMKKKKTLYLFYHFYCSGELTSLVTLQT